VVDSTLTYFYRRSLTLRSGEVSVIVYAVAPTDDKPDPVPVVAAFPAGWRPTEQPAMCLAEPGAPSRYFVTTIPRSQFKHFTRLAESDALAIYPDLLRQFARGRSEPSQKLPAMTSASRLSEALSRCVTTGRVGFEPTRPARVRRFSRPVHSTALPPAQGHAEERDGAPSQKIAPRAPPRHAAPGRRRPPSCKGGSSVTGGVPKSSLT
jgi:hypothetical protein